MRLFEIKYNKFKPLNEGARIDHAEDIIFWEGSRGAMRALEALKSMEQSGHQETTVKWDGSPAVIFGRDENGEFIFTDKSGFGKKGGVGRTKSPEELQDELLGRSGGKNRDNPDRIAFAQKMGEAFTDFEKAVPKDYRGFFKGDLLYYTTPPKQNGAYVFKPNIVEYSVAANSELGQRIGASKAGIVIHREVNEEGVEGPLQNANIFQGKDVLVVPSITVERPADVDNRELAQLESIIKQNAAGIDELLNQETLKQQQMTDFANILYTYTNSKVDTGLQNLGGDFAKWLENNSKISDKKKAKILEYIKTHMTAWTALWNTVSSLMKVKDDIIRQFDAHDATVKASIPGHGQGGEGYVLAHPEGDIKLVPREFFTKANRAVER
jgi:hypothetical protein